MEINTRELKGLDIVNFMFSKRNVIWPRIMARAPRCSSLGEV